MEYLFNIGNTNTQYAALAGGELGAVGYCRTAELDFERFAADDVLIVSTVVPAIRSRFGGREVFDLGIAHAAAAGLDLSKVDASTLGADRLANAIMLARSPERLPAVAIDCGTAITLEIVDRDRCFRGGAILPGRILMRRALHAGTAQLPELPLAERLPSEPGRDTAGSMLFGIDRGAVGAVRELLAVLEHEFGPGLRKVATGGDAGFFCRALPELEAAPETFTLDGLLAAYRAFCCK
ncbi:MAG: type III pantothenate kinase [Victivallaceae bacterium]